MKVISFLLSAIVAEDWEAVWNPAEPPTTCAGDSLKDCTVKDHGNCQDVGADRIRDIDEVLIL